MCGKKRYISINVGIKSAFCFLFIFALSRGHTLCPLLNYCDNGNLFPNVLENIDRCNFIEKDSDFGEETDKSYYILYYIGNSLYYEDEKSKLYLKDHPSPLNTTFLIPSSRPPPCVYAYFLSCLHTTANVLQMF